MTMLVKHPITEITVEIYNQEDYDRYIRRGYLPYDDDMFGYVPDGLSEDALDNKHSGEPAYIIGGGTSLKGLDFTQLKHKLIIACNKSIKDVPFAQYMVYMDDQFYDWYESDIKSFKGIKITHDFNNIVREGVIRVKNNGNMGLAKSVNKGLYTGSNAGYFALNLAVAMKCDPIFLLGIDMCYHKGKTHYHNGYPKEDKIKEVRFIHMKAAFRHGAQELKRRGLNAYNCSPISKLKEMGYPYMSLKKALDYGN